jgi:hypothetical protein
MQDELRRLVDQREAMLVKAAGVGAIRYDKDKVQTSPENSFEAGMVHLVTKKLPIDKRIDFLRYEIRKRTGQIRSIRGRMGAVLYCRYVRGLKWSVICERMDTSYEAVMVLHNRALSVFFRRYLSGKVVKC